MSCVWGKSPVRAALLWKLCDLMEVKSDREGSLLSPVNEKLLVSSGLCVRGQTAGVMWERGQRQTGCLSGGGVGILCRGERVRQRSCKINIAPTLHK